MADRIKSLREKAMRLPLQPGVYIMKDKSDHVIYVGKAKALKNRVSQYFGSEKNHDEKVRQMVAHVHHFEFIVTDSEFEALILECSLIKQYHCSKTIKGTTISKLQKDHGPVLKLPNNNWRTGLPISGRLSVLGR